MQLPNAETKEARKLRKALHKAQNHVVPANNTERFIVLCVRFGTKYGREYVERLRNMVQRHTTVPYEFVCLTDDTRPIEGVRSIVQPLQQQYKKIWWHKVHMFDHTLPLGGRILYFDLDVIICDNIDKFFLNHDKLFLGIKDFNRKFHPSWHYLNSSVLSWVHGRENYIYDEFQKNPAEAQKLLGDQDWIWKLSKNKLQFWPIEWIQSYKWEIRNRDELVNRTGKQGFKFVSNPVIPLGCSVAVFHGDPKMEDVKDTFVIDNWR